MNKSFDSISQGLHEAVAYARDNENGVKVHHVLKPNVKAIRHKTGMNENEFATTLSISLRTLRKWERGARNPRGPALVLLSIIDKAPQTILNLLSQQSR